MNPENVPDNGNAGEKSVRLLRPSVVVLCGPAACGKSTFAERHFRATQIISSDWARARIADDDRDQRYNTQAFALVYFLLEQRLTVNRLCVVDSTALTPQARKELLDLAKKFQVPATLLFFNVPLETCVERDKNRERSVGRVIVERQYQAFEQSRETIRQEGFDQVVEIQEGDLEKIRIDVLFRPVVRAAAHPQQPDVRAPRRFDRPGQPFRPRPRGPEDNGRAAWAPSGPPGARRPGAPPPVTTSGSASPPKVGAPRPGEGPAPVGRTPSPAAAHPPALPAATHPPDLPQPAVANPKAASPDAPRPIPVGAEPPSRG